MNERPIRVYVHLAQGFGGQAWNRRYREGKVAGLNEPWPYGYHHAGRFGCDVTFSQDPAHERLPARIVRLVARGVLGFDLVHAWRNRHRMAAADVIWTHTESQSAAVGLMRRLGLIDRDVRLILQSVWLIDRWRAMLPPHRALFRYCLAGADALTFLSDDNCAQARSIFPRTTCHSVRFGISTAAARAPRLRCDRRTVRVFAAGNDKDRDWATLLAAVSRNPAIKLRIASGTVARAACEAAGAECFLARTADEIVQATEWADVVVVPLKHNLHASGITAIEEAVVLGKPVIASDAGGLRGYFSGEEVRYVPVGDATALRAAIESVRENGADFLRAAIDAQRRMLEGGLDSVGYARRHVELSRGLLARPPLAADCEVGKHARTASGA